MCSSSLVSFPWSLSLSLSMSLIETYINKEFNYTFVKYFIYLFLIFYCNFFEFLLYFFFAKVNFFKFFENGFLWMQWLWTIYFGQYILECCYLQDFKCKRYLLKFCFLIWFLHFCYSFVILDILIMGVISLKFILLHAGQFNMSNIYIILMNFSIISSVDDCVCNYFCKYMNSIK